MESDAERVARLNTEREEELRRVPLQTIDKSKWPKNVRPISTGEADGLGIDLNGRLYWNGRPVEIIGQRLDLTWAQTAIAIVVAVFTGVAAIGTTAQGWVAYHDWACRNKQPAIMACPAAQAAPAGPPLRVAI
ncbi:hypothetical protein NLM33_35795 [Bradyrhizobium sp. CCGUVB1N3]|uniref:hypothetical protein n=1 Tax=Bradyrhizobium sp. CCGUVB1N3 TaxID=2949629 RepID=UPI0020B456B8|nr:hypothetical protein [Bradyrhizobium sp. CCGUVB1N3]MCP3475639.1 hypothetical protein [Bradyrhizobium sp. CCGUVB1N3]